LIAAVDSSLTHYFCYDANGNVGQLVNGSDGSISAHYEYDPFGKNIVARGPEAENNPYLFSTKYFEVETELYYYGYRYYSPQLGRWLRRDPLDEVGNILLRKEKGSKESDLNLYGFTINNPINTVDLFGLTSWDYKGYCRYFSIGEIIGGGTLRCKVWTRCRCDNTREILEEQGELITMFFGLTISAILPGGVTYFNIELEDEDIMAYPELSRLTGFSTIFTAGGAIVIGGAFSGLDLGHARSTSIKDWQAGLDTGSVDAYAGGSWLDGEPEEKCCKSQDDYY